MLTVVFVTVGPENVTVRGLSGAVSTNRPHQVMCEAKGSRPPAILTWYLDGNIVKSVSHVVSTTPILLFYLLLYLDYRYHVVSTTFILLLYLLLYLDYRYRVVSTTRTFLYVYNSIQIIDTVLQDIFFLFCYYIYYST